MQYIYGKHRVEMLDLEVVEINQRIDVEPQQISQSNEHKRPSYPFFHTLIISQRPTVFQQQKGKNQTSRKEKDRSSHAPKERPEGKNGIVVIAIGICKQGICKMPLKHHENSVGPQNIYEKNPRQLNSGLIGFDG